MVHNVSNKESTCLFDDLFSADGFKILHFTFQETVQGLTYQTCHGPGGFYYLELL